MRVDFGELERHDAELALAVELEVHGYLSPEVSP